MKKFRVEVKEIYRTYVDVEAKDIAEAHDIVEKKVVDGDVVVLDDYAYLDREILVGHHPDEIARQIREDGTMF